MAYFKIYNFDKYPIICNIPHGSTVIPNQFNEDFLIDADFLKKESFDLADLYADDLFDPLLKDFGGIVAKVSRLVTDIERFDDDDLESMSKVGMGALYEKSGNGVQIRQLSKERKEQIMDLVYYPYHQNLEKLVDSCIEKFGYCLILDCHSFSATPRSYESDYKSRNLDICLGTSSSHTPLELFEGFKKNFEKNGFKVKENIPFSGTIVPKKHFNKNKKVFSIMMEVNRGLYMNEGDFSKKPQFDDISSRICDVVHRSALDFLSTKL